MSRSLDKDVLENLKLEDPAIVYKDIAKVLTSLPANGTLLDVELLGKSHALEPGIHFLQDGEALAIPKLRLTQAFLVAHGIIQEHLSSRPSIPNRDIIAATAVALLMDPEHLTAANLRKRFILAGLETDEDPCALLRSEKQFLDSLLTARLHRHTKSPTLWSHRRWLVERFKMLNYPANFRRDLTSVIMVAAERHARNYYAWHHARWMINSGNVELKSSTLMDIISDVEDWCFRHHDDTSGWTYLNFVMLKIQDQEARKCRYSAVFAETLNMVESLRWVNESVWVFLRTVVASDMLNSELFQAFLELNARFSSGVKDEVIRGLLDAAAQWAVHHRQIVP
jgi:protein prenyltransferase alpha subunit repeat containing protein 1